MKAINILGRFAYAAVSVIIVISEAFLFQFGNVHLG